MFFCVYWCTIKFNEDVCVSLILDFPSSGVNFVNILCAAFTQADTKIVKISVKLFLGSTCVKAARKMLMKLTPDRGTAK